MSESNPTRRLMIREMVLENFKSYAGAQHVGPFHKSFSSVVGPNGSGKSNVIDAMLFVFGRRAKQLRFNKVSELIHNSTNHQNLECAKVTVHFQEIIDKDGEDFEVVPGTQFTVARTAHRNNQSDYFLNEKKVPVKEVTAWLKGQGIDLDNNRFLILQGEVEQISMMKPKAEDKNDTGLLEYLEDIIGTDKYVTPIEEGSKLLEEINDRRQAMIQRLKISEKEKDSLEGKKNEAEDYLDKQAEMLRSKATGNQLYVKQTQEILAKLEESKTALEAKLTHERSKHVSYDKDSKELEKKFQNAEKEHATIQKALETSQEEFKAFERKDAKIQMELKHLRQKLKKLFAKAETDQGNVAKLEAEVAAAEADVPRCKAQVETFTAELANQESQLEAMQEAIKGEVEGYRQQLSQVRSELAPWEKRMGEVTSRISVANTERELLARKAEDAKRRLDSALQGLQAAKQSAAEKARQIKELEASTKRCRIQIEETQTECASQRKDEARLDVAVKEAREKVASLKSDMGSQQNTSGLVAALMAAKAKGEVSGVFGRLGDLGSIEAKYDIAVSTAVGALDYLVVETASDAQRCVEFLRRNNLGVATFLILEKQRHLASAAAEKVDAPEGAPRLFDLIKFKDERLRTAFYYAMSNTLVAADLEQATRIAYGKDRRFKRVVTLQGQLIAESGTMAGGGGRPNRGRMALGASAPRGGNPDTKAAAAELKTAEQTLESLHQSLVSVRDKAAASEKALRAFEKQLAQLETALPKARMEAEAEATKAQDIQQRLDELEKATKVDVGDAARIKELDGAIRKEEAALAELRAQSADLEKKAAAIQLQIDGAGGEKLKKQRTRVTNMRKDIDDAEADMTRKGVQAKSGVKTIDKLKKEMVKDVKEKEGIDASLEKGVAEVKSMEEEALAVMGRVQDAGQCLDSKREELEAVRSERDRFQTEFGIIRQTQTTIENQLEVMTKTRKEEGNRVARWSAEVESLCAKLATVTGQAGWLVTEEEMAGKKADDCFYRATILEAEMEKMAPDLNAIEEYRSKESDFNARAAELEGVTTERDEARRTYESLRKSRLDEFMAGFNVVSLKLKEMYQMITLGGDAELELVDSLDPFSEGIVFSVRPPKKSWKNISNLSGGEKTLSSLSLVFALHHYKPTPLYVMDEIDAALDFKNVSIVGHYIKERTRNAQFIIISLRNNMFELADRLVGIYKTDNTTKTVTINPAEFAVVEPVGPAAAEQAAEQGAQTGAPAPIVAVR